MPIFRTMVLLTALLPAAGWGLTAAAEPVDQAEGIATQAADPAMDHIEKLEQMLREAGVEPPARPDELASPVPDLVPVPVQEVEEEDKPIVSDSFATVVFETEVAAINERSDKAENAIKFVRRWLDRDDVKRRVAAEDIIEAVTEWSARQTAKIKSSGDEVEAYMLADNAIRLLGQDPLAKPFKRYMMDLQRDRSEWLAIESMAAYRRALDDAEAIGLLSDWALIDFQDGNVRIMIKATTAKLKLIANNWPNSEAAKLAEGNLKEWAAREAQAIADLPAWRYTWQLDLIEIGTKNRTKIVTETDGTVTIHESSRVLYDEETVFLYGTFQNTSDKPYRYTFLAGGTSGAWPKVPFHKLKKHQLLGFELIQTSVLAPGEVYKWEAYVHVDNIRHVNRGGVTMVEVHDRRAGR
ncbi:MAG: hypothetical protein AAGB26_03865 [Planctomycetota bacterium]